MPTFFQKLKAAFKELPFPRAAGNTGQSIIYPNMNSLQEAILRAISPQSGPSSDPHLSSLVAAGITWLGSTLPEPDIQVKKEFLRKRDGRKKDDNVIERHPLYELFKRPNPYTSGSTLWKAFAYSWIIQGNVYFIKFRNSFGQVVQLWYEPHFNIRARWVGDKQGEYITAEFSRSVLSVPRNDSPTEFINYYEVDRDGGKFRLEPADVIHFRDGIDPNSRRYGLSKLSTILREIYGDSAAANYAANLLGGNSVIPYVLGIDDPEGALGQEDLYNIKARLLAQTTGQNAGQPLVVTSKTTFNRTGLTPAELDLRGSRMMGQDVFSQVTGIPAAVLQFSSGLDRSTYNNMREMRRSAIESYLVPLIWHIAQELTVQLLPDMGNDASHFVEFDLTEVAALQEDENERVARIVSLYQGQVIKRSEARTALDFEVDEGKADDVYLVKAGTETQTIEQEVELRENPPEELPPATGFPAPVNRQLVPMSKSLKHPSAAEQAKIREHWERHAPERVKGLISARGR